MYCFPYRDEFVGIGEHTDWDRTLARFFKNRKKRSQRLKPREFVAWPRGEYSDFAGRVSWGVVEFLSLHYAEDLPALARALARALTRELYVNPLDELIVVARPV